MKSFVAFNLALTALLAISSIGISQEATSIVEATGGIENKTDIYSDSQASVSDQAATPPANDVQIAAAIGECMASEQSEFECQPVLCCQPAVLCYQFAPVVGASTGCATCSKDSVDLGKNCQTIHRATYLQPCAGCRHVFFVAIQEHKSNCVPLNSTTRNCIATPESLIPMNCNQIPACRFGSAFSRSKIQGAYYLNGCVKTAGQ